MAYEAAAGCNSARLRAASEVSSQADLAAALPQGCTLAPCVEPLGASSEASVFKQPSVAAAHAQGLKAVCPRCENTCSTCSTTSAIACSCLAVDMQHT